MLGLKHWSKIIDSAAHSPLGIVALAILAISGIIGLLLSNSDQSGAARLVAISGAVGAIFILAALVVAKSANQSAPTTHDHHPQYPILSTIKTVGIILINVGIILIIVAVIWGWFCFALIIGFAPGEWQFLQSKPGIGVRDLAVYNTITLIHFLVMFGALISIIALILTIIFGDLGDPGGNRSEGEKWIGCFGLLLGTAVVFCTTLLWSRIHCNDLGICWKSGVIRRPTCCCSKRSARVFNILCHHVFLLAYFLFFVVSVALHMIDERISGFFCRGLFRARSQRLRATPAQIASTKPNGQAPCKNP